jgi:hypothetical protein
MNTLGRALESPLTAPAAIWASAGLMAIGAPDLVTGSQHEHLPLALITVWLWATAASAYALMTPSRGSLARWTLAVTSLWVATAVVATAAPVMVTGTDPTRIPLAVIIAPPVAAVLTGLLSLHQANLPPRHSSTTSFGATEGQRPDGPGLATPPAVRPRS